MNEEAQRERVAQVTKEAAAKMGGQGIVEIAAAALDATGQGPGIAQNIGRPDISDTIAHAGYNAMLVELEARQAPHSSSYDADRIRTLEQAIADCREFQREKRRRR